MLSRTNATRLRYPINLIADICETRLDVGLVKEHLYAHEDAVRENLEKKLNLLSDREKDVIKYRYIEQMPLRNIADKMDITVTRVNQIRAKILRDLKFPPTANYIIFGPQKDDKENPLDFEIYILGLSVRAYNSLKRANINTVRQVVSLNDDDYMRIRNIGQITLAEIEEKTQMFLNELKSRNNCTQLPDVQISG